MSTRRLLASIVAVCLLIGVVNSRALAAEPAEQSGSEAGPIWKGLVPEDAFAAVVVYPKRVLSNPALAKFDVKSMADDLAKQGGFSPMDLEQVVALAGPPAAGGPLEPVMAFIGHFSTAQDEEKLAAKWVEPRKVEEFELAGHKCFRGAKDANAPKGSEAPNVCFLDSQTFVVASEVWLPKVLGAADTKSLLISAMRSVDPADDVTLIFANTDAVKELIAENLPPQALPGPFKSAGELPDQVRAIKLGVRTTPQVSLKITIVGKDEESAKKIAATITMLQQMGQAFLPALQVPPGQAMPAEARESREYAAGLATKVVNGLTPTQSGKKVTIEIADLGTLDAIISKTVLPVLMAARGAASRASGMNNLKQLALGMTISESVEGHLPANAIYSKDGKPLLSWRVAILPNIGEEALYKQFHLDEPWDSANNKPLIAKMPAVYKGLGSTLPEGQTRFVVPVGKNTIFDGPKGITAKDITDGMSNTILILEVPDSKAVTWTKPEDLEFDAQKPLDGLGSIGEGGFAAAFADGSVRVLKKDIDPETFRWLILRNDGHPIDGSKL